MGEKITGGYAIGIENVVETDKNIIIMVKKINLEPGSMVTQAFTTSFCVVKINSKKIIKKTTISSGFFKIFLINIRIGI